MLRKMMFPKGHVVHYAKSITEGFQLERTICGRVVDFNYWAKLDDWGGMTRCCHNCLKVRFDEQAKELADD